jgi:protoporphyrinogen oxidase
MEVAVIGGGIAGMYMAYKLVEKGCNVTLFEKAEQLGGRVQTIYEKDDIYYEAGAGRFNNNHKLLIRLIRKLGLFNKITSISSKERLYIKGNQKKDFNHLVNELLFNKIIKAKDKYSNNALKSITLKEMMQQEVGNKLATDIVNAFGYNSEFDIQNAYTSLKIFEKDFNESIDYYYLQGGLSQIVNKLYEQLVEAKCTIHVNTSVIDYDYNKNIITFKKNNARQLRYKQFSKVVFCITKNELLKFTGLVTHDTHLLNYINGIQTAPLNRIFARFPINEFGKMWFEGLPRISTDNSIRYIIPHNHQKGFIQISYTDNTYALKWNLLNKAQLEKELLKNLRIMFPNKSIPSPIWIKQYYWDEGATYWKPNSSSYKNKKSNNYIICGEMNSSYKSGWIEGALQSVQTQINKVM